MTDKKEEEKQNASPASPASQASQTESQRDEYLAGWKRALADYDNLKKDLSRERGEMRRATTVELLISLLPIMNNFDAAGKHRPHTDDEAADKWIAGALQIKAQLEVALKDLGAESFDGTGEKFNPELHESAGSRREEEREDGIVLEVVRRGWKVDGKVVCPAKVIINSL
ncbi:MAG: nucleotide exchange factor GrpE [Patescibacteria group bacterium]